ncbi:Flp family type IVb pilin [Vibrio cincinnatiensis]|uniref:Flp family type IVb pilin n=1 Tax=Vibrio cincinnatiensis TaxID=675 RepID=UPI001EDEBFD3|nr:Flp family type IVb pilin [Vibrio cincinnatiensis]MCG3736048.1 Flp family type IVb pilin [Vibrio cincinnatiensis]
MLTKLYVKSRLLLDSFAQDQRGVTAIEYAIIGVAISAIVLAVFGGDGDTGLKASLIGALDTITDHIDKAANVTQKP